MSWQEVAFYKGVSNGRMVLFSGFKSNPDKLVGLIGSAFHIIGMGGLESATLSYAQPSFWMKITEELNPPSEANIINKLYDLDNQIDYEARRRKGGPSKQDVQFVAKTFLSKEGFVLGSPIYVSETEVY